jgi:hypothetical protein
MSQILKFAPGEIDAFRAGSLSIEGLRDAFVHVDSLLEGDVPKYL